MDTTLFIGIVVIGILLWMYNDYQDAKHYRRVLTSPGCMYGEELRTSIKYIEAKYPDLEVVYNKRKPADWNPKRNMLYVFTDKSDDNDVTEVYFSGKK